MDGIIKALKNTFLASQPSSDQHHVGLIDLLKTPDILKRMLTHLPPRDLQTISNLNKTTLSIPTTHFEQHVSRFTRRPHLLRQYLSKTKAIISGSMAGSYFLRPTTWTSHDMDIIVPADAADTLASFWTDVEKYTEVRRWNPRIAINPDYWNEWSYDPRNLYEVWTFEIWNPFFRGDNTRDNPGGDDAVHQVQLILVEALKPLEKMLLDYPMSNIVCLISGSAAYCVFPKTCTAAVSLENRSRRRVFSAGDLIRKYDRRGVRVDGMLEEDSVVEFEGTRTIADSKAWVMRFEYGSAWSDEQVEESLKAQAELENLKWHVQLTDPYVDLYEDIPAFRYDPDAIDKGLPKAYMLELLEDPRGERDEAS